MNDGDLKSVDDAIAALRKQPSINTLKLRAGTKVLVETTQHIYALRFVDPIDQQIVEVQSTDNRIQGTKIGQFVRSSYDRDGKVSIEGWISKSMRMQILFQNGTLLCTPTLSARLEGEGWSYNVF